jgi:hypothetical protein
VDYLEATATISPCGLFRYDLTRVWNPDRERVAFCMLNPSTADGTQDDPTIRRCVGFADAWGYGGLVVVNLFALRATDPKELTKTADPVGPDNDRFIERHAAGNVVVAAWGANPSKFRRPLLRNRPAAVIDIVSGYGLWRHLGLTADKHPRHPLYLPRESKPQPFPGPIA